MSDIEKTVQDQLLAMQDLKYRNFQCKLIPTVDPATVIGIRTPELRKFAKAFAQTPEATEFLQIPPHKYYEDNNLHGFLIETMKDYGQVIAALDAFLPFVDNWATCDQMSPKIFRKHLRELLEQIKVWMASGHTYTIRFGIEMLMTFYLGEEFQPEYLALVAGIHSEEYYVNMMIACFFCHGLSQAVRRSSAVYPARLPGALDPK